MPMMRFEEMIEERKVRVDGVQQPEARDVGRAEFREAEVLLTPHSG